MFIGCDRVISWQVHACFSEKLAKLQSVVSHETRIRSFPIICWLINSQLVDVPHSEFICVYNTIVVEKAQLFECFHHKRGRSKSFTFIVGLVSNLIKLWNRSQLLQSHV